MLLKLQNIILKMVAKGDSLEATLSRLCLEVEALAPDAICSILSLDGDGRLHPLAAPSLPPEYSAALDNIAAGPDVGSCGTAAYLGAPVAVTDIENDPLWADYRSLPLPLGLLACWSSPICGNDGRVMGTFAFYYRRKRGPTAFEQDIVEACLPLCVIAFERHESALEQRRLAFTDSLTGLPNRTKFNEIFRAQQGTDWSLLLIDVDKLKQVNDTFGHGAGDELIAEVSQRIARAVAPLKAYRLGGDEFAVLMPSTHGRSAAAVADRVLAAVGVPAHCRGQAVLPTVSIGGATCLDPSQTPETVRQNADFALYHAKETMRGGFVMHDESLGTAISKRFNAIRNLATALEEDRVEPFYQPILRLDTREIVGVEALCRIVAPDGSVIPASDFHEATKDAHVAANLTRRMVALVARDVAGWLGLGIPFQHVGINVSAADFHGGQLSRLLKETFEKENVPLSHAILEVTESVYLSGRDTSIADEIQSLRAGGLKVALDDFGTGFASLTHLLTVPVDIIKIDKSFVDRLAPDDMGAGIIEGIMHIARSLNIRVVAEGIEVQDQADQLRRMGCLLGQGYLYSKAVPKATMTAMLLAHSQPTVGQSVSRIAEARSQRPLKRA